MVQIVRSSGTRFLHVFALLCAGGAVGATDVGEKAPRFVVKDIRFVSRELADFGAKKAFVVAFLDRHCPVAAKYAPRLEELWRQYRSRNVVFLGIYAAPSETVVEIAADALERGITFPVHRDFDQTAVAALGITRTPEVVVLDAAHVLRYRGRIDDQFRVAGAAPKVRVRSLADALDAVLEGKNPAIAETSVEGCRITGLDRSWKEGVTYAEHVAPIIARHCQPCHRPKQAAPFSLLDYEDASRHARRIAEVVAERRMPPSFKDPRYGEFANHHALTAEEIAQVVSWARSGAELGDPKKLPEPLAWPDSEWGIDSPDLILSSPKEFEVPATGYVDYKYVDLDYEFEYDTWISQIQVLPGNRRVVHHANLYARTPFGNILVTGHVPGGDVTRYGKNAGIMIPRGTKLSLQIHYTTTGKVERDRTRVGIVYPKEPIHRRVQCLFLINNKFEIPPHATHHEVRHRGELRRDAVGLALFVHMHLRGKDMTFRAQYPDGRTELLLSVPNYNFDWQLAYRWNVGEKRFPAGTVIETVSHYDNSEFNPFNPDPSATVREGRQSYHEMNYGFVFYHDEGEKLDIRVDPNTGRAVK